MGLTVRPGEVLRDSLGGVRVGLSSPGRYLLAAVVVDVTVDRLFAWLGDEDVPWVDPGCASSMDNRAGGGFVGSWVSVEFFSVLGTSLIGYAVGLALLSPEAYEISVATMTAAFALFAFPILLHAGAEAYYRHR